MKSIGFGAYDGYHSVGFGEFGIADNCGQVGELCKDRVKKEDIQELIDRINQHKECAEKQPHPCLFLHPLRKTITMCLDYIDRLMAEGNRQAANYLVQALDEMGQLIGIPEGAAARIQRHGLDTYLDASLEPWIDDKYRELPWSEISKYMYYSLARAGDSGGALKYVVAARDSIHFMRNVTPAEDARRANTIRQLIDRGRHNGSTLGQASSLIKKAWITEATRKQLQSELNEAYKTAKIPNPDATNLQILGSAVFSIFAPEGQEDIYMEAGKGAAEDLESGDPLRKGKKMGFKNVFDLDSFKFAADGDMEAAKRRGEKMRGEKCFTFDVKCHYKKNKYPLIAAGVGVALLVGFLLTR